MLRINTLYIITCLVLNTRLANTVVIVFLFYSRKVVFCCVSYFYNSTFFFKQLNSEHYNNLHFSFPFPSPPQRYRDGQYYCYIGVQTALNDFWVFITFLPFETEAFICILLYQSFTVSIHSFSVPVRLDLSHRTRTLVVFESVY